MVLKLFRFGSIWGITKQPGAALRVHGILCHTNYQRFTEAADRR